VAPRVSPTEAIRAEIHQLFASDGELLSVLEQVARLSVWLTFQSVIEEIVCEELGRGRYERRSADSPEGYRNGQQPRTLKTSLGPVQLQRPKLRHAHAALCDQLFGQSVTRTNALETLVISCWVRGLSDRDVEAMLVEVFGEDATISRTTASRICQRLRAEFDAWRRRDLSKAKIDYLFLDGSFFKMHPKARAEPVLAAWGIDTDGHAVFLGLGPGAAESTDAWRGFLEDLGDRGLSCPLLVISDGGKGLCAAIECSFAASLHQRCLVHVCRINRPSGSGQAGAAGSRAFLSRSRCPSRLWMTCSWRATSASHWRWAASSRRAWTSASWCSMTGMNSGAGTKLSHCSQMLAYGQAPAVRWREQ
jgi:transposase-like protein